ncbi:NADPH-dependent 1-acyl dihydroxyacetone phosphate reductase [Knufia peltigerae]|uniref:NADPH-dependent 1-acyl dihydroxyacetone phosphate reductase n=1 Tax=Knufia peltigerae TaxID=1002370 RepID=A0AA38YFF8_9EURO|nr:NADPH-dependent 1-acyl dihydroxyacetone phosphate reductase [Knufia peltigerae]
MSPRNKSILITGCSRGGIGHALAVECQRRGMTVFATARTPSKMSDLEDLPNVTLLSLDVTSPTSIADAVKQVGVTTAGHLDYLLNNSGQDIVLPALDLDIDQGKKMFDVNFWGVLRMIQAFAPLLIESSGTIVNIGSIVAYLNTPYTAVYNSSKAAIHMLSDTLRLELAPLNIKVLTVVTGSVKTNIHQNSPKFMLPTGAAVGEGGTATESRYLAVSSTLEKRWNDQVDYDPSTPQDFARDVIGDVLAGATGKIWRGRHASETRWARYFMPVWLSDMILTRGTDLDKVGKL